MDKKLKLNLIRMAQKFLLDNPQDYIHEITHHYRTVLLAKEISLNIDGTSFDSDLLEVLCWWHDVKVPGLDYSNNRVVFVVSEYLSSLLDSKYTDLIKDSIENHEFGSIPSFLEGKILQDADKLETLSVERIRLGIEAVEAGFLDKNSTLSRFNEFISSWIPKMPERYNFEYSKKKHFELLETAKPDFDNLAKYLNNN